MDLTDDRFIFNIKEDQDIMLFDEDAAKPKKPVAPRNLEKLSVDELEQYIRDLKAEIERVEAEIRAKRAHRDAASSLFKS